METRKAFEKVRSFVDWEYKEKRPKSVKALRVKSKTAFTIGALPDYQMRSHGPIIFVVVSDYGDNLTVYFFNRFGDKLGSKKYESTPKFRKELAKSTTLKYHLPKEEKIIYEDTTSVLQKEFSKLHQQLNHKLGISYKYPYAPLVDNTLKFTVNSRCGCKKIKNELHIPSDLKEKGYFEITAIFEWFHSYLMLIISTTEDANNELIISELSLLLSAVYIPEHAKNILKLINIDYKIEIRGQQFNLTQSMKTVLTSLTEIPQMQKSELRFLLKRYIGVLELLKKYEIQFSLIEIIQLFVHSCEVFNSNNDTYVLYNSKEEDITGYFYFRIFSRSLELAKQLEMEELAYKTFFFTTIFGLTILDSKEIETIDKSLTEIIDNTQSMMNNPIVYSQIGKIDNLASDILSKYIVSQLSLNIQHAIEGNALNVILEIQNPTNYPLQDFSYKLSWKPQNRIMLTTSTDISKSRDLHERLKRNYLFDIQNRGLITISCVIAFNDPLISEKIIKKSVILDKININ